MILGSRDVDWKRLLPEVVEEGGLLPSSHFPLLVPRPLTFSGVLNRLPFLVFSTSYLFWTLNLLPFLEVWEAGGKSLLIPEIAPF